MANHSIIHDSVDHFDLDHDGNDNVSLLDSAMIGNSAQKPGITSEKINSNKIVPQRNDSICTELPDKLGSVIEEIDDQTQDDDDKKKMRKKLRNIFKIENFELEQSGHYLNEMTFDVNLKDLYTVEETCLSNKNSYFCPVLLKVNDKELLKYNDGFDYLIQIWTKVGLLYYERKLKKKPLQWSISGKLFLFQEQEDENILYVVKLREKNPCTLFTIMVPIQELHDDLNGYDYIQKINLINQSNIDFSKTLDQKKEDEQSVPKALIGFSSGYLFFSIKQKAGNAKIFYISIQKKILIQTEKKDNAQIDETDLLLKEEGYEVKPKLAAQIQLTKKFSNLQCTNKGAFEKEIKIISSDLKTLDIDPAYEVFGFQEISGPQIDAKLSESTQLGQKQISFALILKNKVDHQLKFLKIVEKQSLNNEKATTLQLIQLGQYISLGKGEAEQKAKGIKKWFSIIMTDHDLPYNICVVLRKDGSVDFYYNFMLIEQYENKENIIDDICFDFHFIFLRTAFEKDKSDKRKAVGFKLFKINQTWLENIGMSVKEEDKYEEAVDLDPEEVDVKKVQKLEIAWQNAQEKLKQKWTGRIDSQIASYFKLYQSFFNFETYFMLCHRNFVSIFSIAEAEWKHYSYSDTVRAIALGLRGSNTPNEDTVKHKKRRYTDKYKISVIVGSSEIHGLVIDKKLNEKWPKTQPDKIMNTDGRVLRVYNDEVKFQGFYVLIRYEKKQQMMISEKGDPNSYSSMIYNSSDPNTNLRLLLISENRQDVLLDQSKDKWANELLSESCTFVNFKQTHDKPTKEQEKELKESLEKGNEDIKLGQQTMLMIFNPQNNKVGAFKLIGATEGDWKKKNAKDSEIQKTKLQWICEKIKQPGFRLKEEPKFTLSLRNAEKKAKLRGAFRINSESQGASNYLVICTDHTFYVFDADLKPKFEFFGFKIGTIRKSDDYNLYVLQEVNHKFHVKGFQPKTKSQLVSQFQAPGLYVIDLFKLLRGDFQSYRLFSCSVGNNKILSFSNYSQRLSFIQNTSVAQICPYVHRNTINLLGVREKQDYLIWREKGGFFSALRKDGVIQTWSLATGKKMYDLKCDKLGGLFKQFEVYQANDDDQSYQRDYLNLKNKSQSLIVSIDPTKTLPSIFKKTETQNSSRQLKNRSKKKNISDARKDQEKELQKIVSVDGNQSVNIEVFTNQDQFSFYKFYYLEMFGHLDNEKADYRSNLINSIADANSQKAKRLESEYIKEQKTISDLKKDECVEILMEFDFKVRESLEGEQIREVGWDTETKPAQHIYISLDGSKLLEVVNNNLAVIYKQQEINEKIVFKCGTIKDKKVEKDSDNGASDGNREFIDNPKIQLLINEGKVISHKQVHWEEETVITRFPKRFQKNIPLKFLFSNNFTYFLHYDYSENQVVIMKTEDQKPYCRIPSDMINFNAQSGKKSQEQIQLIGRNICFFKCKEEKRLRIITKDHVDCIFEFDEKKFKMISYSKLNNFTATENLHNILLLSFLKSNQVFERQIRKVRNFSTFSAHETARKGYVDNAKLLEELYTIDYSQETFISELSFSPLNWIITEKLVKDSTFSLEKVSRYKKLEIIFNIFPKQKTIMHKLAENKDVNQTENMSNIVQGLFDCANQKLDTEFAGFKAGKNFEVPITSDVNDATPIDLSLGITNRQEKNLSHNEIMKKMEKQGNFFCDLQMASVFIKNIKDYSFLHQGQLIIETIISCISLGVPEIADFLDSRFKKIKTMPSQIQYELKPEVEFKMNGVRYGAVIATPWDSTELLKQEMYQSTGSNVQYNNYIYDLPNLHTESEVGRRFIDAIDDQSDISFYAHKSIQMLINYHWREWQGRIWALKLIPYLIMLSSFWIWSNIILQKSHDDTSEMTHKELIKCEQYRKADIVLSFILIACASFFLLTEIEQIISRPRDYMIEFAGNISDIAPLGLLYKNTIDSLIHPKPLNYQFWVVQSVTAVFLWLKFIFFLRSNDQFAFLIRTLMQATRDIAPFFVVLLFSVIGFADAYLSIQNSQIVTNQSTFLDHGDAYEALKFSWLLVLAGQGTGVDTYDVYGFIFFFVSTVIQQIIMLTVLIAIVANSLSAVQVTRIEYSYKEKATLICELSKNYLLRLVSRPKIPNRRE